MCWLIIGTSLRLKQDLPTRFKSQKVSPSVMQNSTSDSSYEHEPSTSVGYLCEIRKSNDTVCLSVCLCVCLPASKISQKIVNELCWRLADGFALLLRTTDFISGCPAKIGHLLWFFLLWPKQTLPVVVTWVVGVSFCECWQTVSERGNCLDLLTTEKAGKHLKFLNFSLCWDDLCEIAEQFKTVLEHNMFTVTNRACQLLYH